MRNFLPAAWASTCILATLSPAPAGSFDAQGQFVGVVRPQIAALLQEFPDGGAGLRVAIARTVAADPPLADDAVQVARSASAANGCQKESVRAGVADAANLLAKSRSASSRNAEQRIRAALRFDSPDIRIKVCVLQAPDLTPGIPGLDSPPAAGQCVSSSRPGC
jgi:hypothetical protein